MTSDPTWDAPGPGLWRHDPSHFAMCTTRMLQAVVPASIRRGYRETIEEFGLLATDRSVDFVNGFFYSKVETFDMGDSTEVLRRAALAERAFSDKIWFDTLQHWDNVVKPQSLAAHRRFADEDLAAMDDDALRRSIHERIDHWREMWVQHFRFNGAAMVPVGDFVAHASRWTGKAAAPLFALFDGWSPVSSVMPPELEPAIHALRADSRARALVLGEGTAQEIVAELCEMLAPVEGYLRGSGYRLGAGFDITNPTIGERPDVFLGRLRAALDHTHDDSRERSQAVAAEVRAGVPPEHRSEFDRMLDEARTLYRLRDERGVYSDSSAAGLLRLALIELGRRLVDRGRINFLYDTLDLAPDEIDAVLDGSPEPSAAVLSARVLTRKAATLQGAPITLGGPPPPPLDLAGAPEPLVRLMTAMMLYIGGVFGEAAEATSERHVVQGIAGASGTYEGRARLVRNFDELLELDDGEVLVTAATGESFNAFLHLCGAIVTDHGSYASHAAIMSREMGLPAVVGTVVGTKRIPNGALVRVDGTAGTVEILDA